MRTLTIHKSRAGWAYLAVGILACSVFAAIGAANTQDVNFGILMSWIALVFYVALFELAAMIKATTKIVVIVAGGLGLIVCFWMIGAVSDSVIHGRFSVMPYGQFWWALPLALTCWTAREIYNRKRPNAKI